MLSAIKTGFERGLVIPYLGPGVLTLATGGNPVPASPEELKTKKINRIREK